MSRGVFLLGIAIAVVAVAFAVTDWLIAALPGVTEANVRRIRAGMTQAEVERLLGRRRDFTHPTLVPSDLELCWESRHGTAVVRFSRDGLVKGARFIPQPASIHRLRLGTG